MGGTNFSLGMDEIFLGANWMFLLLILLLSTYVRTFKSLLWRSSFLFLESCQYGI